VNNELEITWKEAGVTKFQVPSWNLPEGTERNHEDRRCLETPECEAKVFGCDVWLHHGFSKYGSPLHRQ
jgi:hypothetical protein